MAQLNIFVSSTCYDLSQIRTDLYEAIQHLGHNPILSEFADFPIDPARNTVENCMKAIKDSADIFVLIIGNRYGHRIDSGKSITNLEYLAAKNKGIPIYVFISKQLIYQLPIYIKNKNSDYSSVVDNPQIFEFANEVRSNSGLWNFEFEKFQDIRNILIIQLSYLFKESLQLRDKINQNLNYDFHSKLSSQALKIILNKEDLYEYEFLAQVLVDEISKYETLKNDYQYKIILSNHGSFENDYEFVSWISNRLKGTTSYLPNLDNLINLLIPKYIDEPGLPSDLKGLYYIGNTYGRVYKSFIDWTIETLSYSVEENQIELRDALADITSNLINTIWNFPFDFLKSIESTKKRVLLGEKDMVIDMTIVMKIDEDILNRYNKAFNAFERSLK